MRVRSPRLPASLLILLALGVLGAACSTPAADDDATGDGEEAGESSDAIVPITEPDETAPEGTRPVAALDHLFVRDLFDVRGMGDSGWSGTHQQTAMSAGIGAALDRFDGAGVSYRGDLTFINWETVVGTTCTTFGSAYSPGRSYAFVSRPENVRQLTDRGFNLFALSNNHSRDCYGSPETRLTGEAASPDMTAKALAALGDSPALFAGVASAGDARDYKRARVRSFQVKGRTVRVAFGSLYTGRPTCPNTACKADATALFESLRDAQAELRILAMHSMAAADQDELVRLGIRFVKDYGGDVVYGHGPHVWKPVRVVRKNGGGTGVVFESLGNFLHPSLGVQAKNFIGRALFDADSLALAQVQLVPVRNAGTEVTRSTADARTVPSNLRWSTFERGVWANVKP